MEVEISVSDNKDDITSVTANDYSVIEDDVDSIDLSSRIVKIAKENKINSYKNNADKEIVYNGKKSDVEMYDLNNLNDNNWPERSTDDDDDAITVVAAPNQQILVTKHEINHNQEDYYSAYDVKDDNGDISNSTNSSVDLGRQISQLARRIESLGHISRMYDGEQHSCPFNQKNCVPLHNCENCLNEGCADNECHIYHHESTNYSRKMDDIQRVQKRQESMQHRLLELTQKLNKTVQQRSSSQKENVNPKKKDNVKSTTGKGKKTKQKPASPGNNSFISCLLNEQDCDDDDDDKFRPIAEQPLRNSNCYLPVEITMNSDSSGYNTGVTEMNACIPEKTYKHLNRELDNIRQEFRQQVQEIRKLLSHKYQEEKVIKLPEVNRHSCDNNCCSTVPVVPAKQICCSDINDYYPLDRYLEKTSVAPKLNINDSEYKAGMRPGLLPTVARAIRTKQRMLSDPVEAEKFLIELSSRRSNLENNIQALERTKQSEFVFNLLRKLQGDEYSVEVARIEAMVDDAILGSCPEVRCQVEKEYESWLAKREQQREHEAKIKADLAAAAAATTAAVAAISNSNIGAGSGNKRAVRGGVKQKLALTRTGPIESSNIRHPVCVKRMQKYRDIHSKIDSGLSKKGGGSSRPSSRVPASYSVAAAGTAISTVVPRGGDIPETHSARQQHPAWANRRRYRQPYLHFVNDVKLARKPIAPLSDTVAKLTPAKSSSSAFYQKTRISDENQTDITPIGYRQYSLDYKDSSDLPDIDNSSRNRYNLNNGKTAGNNIEMEGQEEEDGGGGGGGSGRKLGRPTSLSNSPLSTSSRAPVPTVEVSVSGNQPSNTSVRPGGSPTFSEPGIGVRMDNVGTAIGSNGRSRGREGRVEPFTTTDPLEQYRTQIHVMQNQNMPILQQRQRPDEGMLRVLIERLLLDKCFSDESLRPSLVLSNPSISQRDIVSTPHQTIQRDSTKTSLNFDDDATLSYGQRSRAKTPEVSMFDNSARSPVSTPSSPFKSSSISRRGVAAGDLDETADNEKLASMSIVAAPAAGGGGGAGTSTNTNVAVAVATQTAVEQAVQTKDIIIRSLPTSPTTIPASPVPASPRRRTDRLLKQTADTDSLISSTDWPLDNDDTGSETVPNSFSDGVWLMDRSEGEMAPHPIDPTTRWHAGPCSELPNWPEGTRRIMEDSDSNTPSFGEFKKPTLPGVIPTQDPVLQVMQMCRHFPLNDPVAIENAAVNDGELMQYLNYHQYDAKPDDKDSTKDSQRYKNSFSIENESVNSGLQQQQQQQPNYDGYGSIEFDNSRTNNNSGVGMGEPGEVAVTLLSEDDHEERPISILYSPDNTSSKYTGNKDIPYSPDSTSSKHVGNKSNHQHNYNRPPPPRQQQQQQQQQQHQQPPPPPVMTRSMQSSSEFGQSDRSQTGMNTEKIIEMCNNDTGESNDFKDLRSTDKKVKQIKSNKQFLQANNGNNNPALAPSSSDSDGSIENISI